MNIYEKITNPNVPSFLCYQPAALRGAPHSVEISDHWRVYGSGIGPAAEKAAIGEFYERRHFYLEVTPDSKSKLGQTLSKAEQSSFINAFQQTALPTVSKKTLDSHVFNMNNVIRTRDFSACSIPTVCISLNDHLLNEDNAVYPMRDTCGCSFHHSLSGAVTGAITESLERQFLTRFWLTNRYANLISNADAHRLIDKTTAAPLLRFLERNAQISLINISDTRFPGSCILAVYGNSDNNAKVKYCAGMCYGADVNTAIEKSLLELWQTFRFMAHYLNTKSASERIEDSYLQHFLSINSYQTYLSILGFHARDCLDNSVKVTAFDLSTILKQVNKLGHGGYLYIKPTTLNHQTFYYCKFTSPCLFMHMNNSSNINIENNYSMDFISEISPSRKSAMVPFP